MRTCYIVIFILLFNPGRAFTQADIRHYKFELELTDSSDRITGRASITLAALEDLTGISLALDSKRMTVSRVITGKDEMKFTAAGNNLNIKFPATLKTGTEITFTILYGGIPSDGLIISKNKFGKRTFFADNWPDRAHFWIPCKEDPADKASFEFLVTAPVHYQVVSNGVQIEETNLPGNRKFTHWKEDIPLSTKIMAIGVADFAVSHNGNIGCIPVSSWVYPDDREKGFYDFEIAKDILAWMIDYIGPFPFKKLAHVESTTIFGGMENAGAIFYNETGVQGARTQEATIAHETAHQWFGDMATEKKYAHLWLSEGFATYLSHLYIGSKYGEDKLAGELDMDRIKIIDFTKSNDNPVVDTLSPTMQLLNANSYDKGSWFLHMLHTRLGDTLFRQVIRTYYEKFSGINADTKDFQGVAEMVSGKDLEHFFRQWLYNPGLPELKVTWSYSSDSKNIILTVEQLQKNLFEFPLEVLVHLTGEKAELHTLSVSRQSQQFSIPAGVKPGGISLDPRTSLLFEGTVKPIN